MLAATAATLGPHWLLYVGAASVGASMGSMGALVRARWSHILTSPTHLHTAYSWESTLDEVVFMVGPVLATLLATSVTPTGGLLLAAAASGIGGLWLLTQRGSEPPKGGTDRSRPTIVSWPLVGRVVSFVAMGAVFGATDVSVVAFTDELGNESLAGLVLAVFALGSGLAGFVYGARHWSGPTCVATRSGWWRSDSG